MINHEVGHALGLCDGGPDYPGHANFDRRWDLRPGSIGPNWIDISDLTSLNSVVSGNPPMNNGTAVFGTAFVCSAHPAYGD